MSDITIERFDEFRWIIPPTGGMRVPGIIYADERMMKTMGTDESPKQVANVAHLPGIVGHSLAMPDIHWGMGSPSAVSRPLTCRKGLSLQAVWGMTSTAAFA